MGIENEGTVSFWILKDKEEWTNDKGYKADIDRGGIRVRTIKHPDQTFEVQVSGPFGQSFRFIVPIPVPQAGPEGTTGVGANIIVVWKNQRVSLYVNGTLAGKSTASKMKPPPA